VIIPKRCRGKLRPLDIIGQKVVQKAIAIALDIIFEDTMSTRSHGFRLGKGVHSAMWMIKSDFGGITYTIEGDIKNCFGEIDHGILIETLGKKVSCQKFLKLIENLLKTGFIDTVTGERRRRTKGVPQGCIPGPVLANIYLTHLDRFIFNELIKKYNGKRPQYPRQAFWDVFNKAKDAASVREGNRISKVGYRDMFCKYDYTDPKNFYFKYVRYADDFVVGVFGPESLALNAKEMVKVFLRDHLKLQLREEKTVITPGTKRFTFLGIKVTTRPRVLIKNKYGFFVKPDPLTASLRPNKEAQIRKLEEKGYVRMRKTGR